MNHDYYNIKYYDKDICSNIYIILLDEISILFNNIPYRKITGPPDDFPYFKKIIDHIIEIIKIFETNNSNERSTLDPKLL